MNGSLWRLHDVTLGPPDQARLRCASGEIPQGITAVMGSSGAGKSSLLELLVSISIIAVLGAMLLGGFTLIQGRQRAIQAGRDAALRAQRLRLEHLEALAAVQAQRLVEVREAARAGRHGFAAAGDADIEIVEGIGPKIAEVLRARGLGSFGALALASPGTLREILDDTGPAYRIADPSTWPEQARLAADGRWDELRSLQDSLNAGRR